MNGGSGRGPAVDSRPRLRVHHPGLRRYRRYGNCGSSHERQRLRFVAGIEYLQPELPALEGHEHLAELLPTDLSAIKDNQRHVTPFGIVPLDSPTYPSGPQSGVRLRRRQCA